MTISKMTNNHLDMTRLYEEIMETEGYDDEFLGDVFDHLVQIDTLAKAFMVKSQNLPPYFHFAIDHQWDGDLFATIAAQVHIWNHNMFK
ncbi:hypothetical protein FXO38_17067 [Capsicum annuum]|nr:hypothetical protein FXO38_17067 [Capsicum annuum]KAF3672271.1 hypothetical protein FXO37_07618 [Capsicum annuum]